MNNYKIINSSNILENLEHYRSKKICAMVKSNAYGHGIAQIVEILEQKVEIFGVVSVEEALAVRKRTSKPILICSKVTDFKTCKKHHFDVMVDDEQDLRRAYENGLGDSLHLKINVGMNRFGVKSNFALRGIDKFLENRNIRLKSIYTHFPRTYDKKSTEQSYRIFEDFLTQISQSQSVPICFGGSGIFDYNFDYDILRVGLGLYGYGEKGLLPVMKILSRVSKIFYAKKGEYVGYGTAFKVTKGSFFAVVPVGYGDGLRRCLSGNFKVKIYGKSYRSVGNICMDAFFVKVDGSVGVGDEVEVMADAEIFAQKAKTIPYEILTGFSNFRGKTIIV